MRRFDILVLGAGSVGVSAAWHLARRGLSVALIDRRGPGEETSFGNAGILEAEGFVPLAVPRDPKLLLEFALNRRTEAHYHLSALPKVAPWLWRLFKATDAAGIDRYAAGMAPLKALAVSEHAAMAESAGAGGLITERSWMRLYRSEAAYAGEARLQAYARRYGVPFQVLSPGEVGELEPHLAPVAAKATLWPGSRTVTNPGRLVAAYAEDFARAGGTVLVGDAASLARADGPDGPIHQVETREGPVTAPKAVVALGPWAMDLLGRHGVSLPFAVKRGYHVHYRPKGNAVLGRPVVDMEYGFVLNPMETGIRMTSGVEFALRDAPKTPVQIARLDPIARALFPLDERIEAEPWMGARPCLSDSLPAIGPVPGVDGLYASIGHGHLGLTLGPVSGRLLADLVTGAPPVVDPAPYRLDRFRDL